MTTHFAALEWAADSPMLSNDARRTFDRCAQQPVPMPRMRNPEPALDERAVGLRKRGGSNEIAYRNLGERRQHVSPEPLTLLGGKPFVTRRRNRLRVTPTRDRAALFACCATVRRVSPSGPHPR